MECHGNLAGCTYCQPRSKGQSGLLILGPSKSMFSEMGLSWNKVIKMITLILHGQRACSLRGGSRAYPITQITHNKKGPKSWTIGQNWTNRRGLSWSPPSNPSNAFAPLPSITQRLCYVAFLALSPPWIGICRLRQN